MILFKYFSVCPYQIRYYIFTIITILIIFIQFLDFAINDLHWRL